MDLIDIKHACECYYGFVDAPFSLTPDTGFYVDIPESDDAFESIIYALGAGEGFIKITGEVGTGKTLLCRRLLNYLETHHAETAYIPNPTLSPTALWVAIGAELGLSGHRRLSYLRFDVQKKLLNLATEGKKLVLIVDEAQCTPPETLEALRLISNLETERQKLIQIVLFGQPELNQILNRQEFRQLKQRISTSAELKPFESIDVLAHYLNRRLLCAGYQGDPLFTRTAIRRLLLASNGTPRIVNILADKALLIGFGRGDSIITNKHIEDAINDTESVSSDYGWHKRLRFVMGF